MKKNIFRLETILQAFIALSALPSGAAMMIFPGGVLNMPLSMLKDSPFKNFFFPGLILFAVIGAGHAVALVLNLRRHRLNDQAAAMMGLGLMIWIFVQVSMIGGGHWLQYLYFFCGVGEVSLAVLLLTDYR